MLLQTTYPYLYNKLKESSKPLKSFRRNIRLSYQPSMQHEKDLSSEIPLKNKFLKEKITQGNHGLPISLKQQRKKPRKTKCFSNSMIKNNALQKTTNIGSQSSSFRSRSQLTRSIYSQRPSKMKDTCREKISPHQVLSRNLVRSQDLKTNKSWYP